MIDAILGIIGTIIYPLFSIIFGLIDLVQSIFRKFAGVETIYYNEGGGTWANANNVPITSGKEGVDILADNNGGIVYYMLRSDLVMNVVWSIATLAFILLIVFTVIAFIRNIYAPKSKPWQEIIGLSIKGLFNFIFIPVVCLVGVVLGNILLNAIDGATSTGGAMSISRKLFLSAAYDANIYRQMDTVTVDNANKAIKLYNKHNGSSADIAELEKGSETREPEYYANLVDEAFANGSGVETSIYEVLRVGVYYNAWAINYLTLAVGGIFMMYALGTISFGMIKRLFTLIVLFIISPAASAMYPLDEGNACKQITGDFKKNTISAYGAVAGLNIFFSIAPMISNINLGQTTFFQSILHIILLICGLFMVKDIISMISNYFGAGNAYSDGQSLGNQIKTKAVDTVKTGAQVYGAFSAARTVAKATGKHGFFNAVGTLASSGATSLMKAAGIDVNELKESTSKTKEGILTNRGKRQKLAEQKKKEKEAIDKLVDDQFNTSEIQAEIQRRMDKDQKAYEDGTRVVRPDERKFYERDMKRELRKKVKKERYALLQGDITSDSAAEYISKIEDPELQKEMALRYSEKSKGKVTSEDILSKVSTIKGMNANVAKLTLEGKMRVEKAQLVVDKIEEDMRKPENADKGALYTKRLDEAQKALANAMNSFDEAMIDAKQQFNIGGDLSSLFSKMSSEMLKDITIKTEEKDGKTIKTAEAEGFKMAIESGMEKLIKEMQKEQKKKEDKK